MNVAHQYSLAFFKVVVIGLGVIAVIAAAIWLWMRIYNRLNKTEKNRPGDG